MPGRLNFRKTFLPGIYLRQAFVGRLLLLRLNTWPITMPHQIVRLWLTVLSEDTTFINLHVSGPLCLERNYQRNEKTIMNTIITPCVKKGDEIIGHLLRSFSCISWFLLCHGTWFGGTLHLHIHWKYKSYQETEDLPRHCCTYTECSA